ncbi:hypothetical protein Nepgr_018695 [Nepenthes gracilis]|uniref:Uncharacterized protein n=1 Tax=Nepenthes gracilis TaxID=150966 RepID=A0AAD3STV9_NEPGR|nr:hypothetical protein Nepgr_018695 [Nepenthes gracilis]
MIEPKGKLAKVFRPTGRSLSVSQPSPNQPKTNKENHVPNTPNKVLVEGVLENRSSNVALFVNSPDFVLTPNSITKLSCKYSQGCFDQIEEEVEDEDDFSDPMLNALKMLLEANATQIYLDSLTLKGRQTVRDFMEKSLLAQRSVRRVSEVHSNQAQERVLQVTTPSSPEQDGTWKLTRLKVQFWCAGWRPLASQRVDRKNGFWPVNSLTGQLGAFDWMKDGLVESPEDCCCCRFGVVLMWPICPVWMRSLIASAALRNAEKQQGFNHTSHDSHQYPSRRHQAASKMVLHRLTRKSLHLAPEQSEQTSSSNNNVPGQRVTYEISV